MSTFPTHSMPIEIEIHWSSAFMYWTGGLLIRNLFVKVFNKKTKVENFIILDILIYVDI